MPEYLVHLYLCSVLKTLTDDLLQRKLSTTYTLSTAMEVSYKAIKSTTLVKVLKYKKEAFIYHSHPPPSINSFNTFKFHDKTNQGVIIKIKN